MPQVYQKNKGLYLAFFWIFNRSVNTSNNGVAFQQELFFASRMAFMSIGLTFMPDLLRISFCALYVPCGFGTLRTIIGTLFLASESPKRSKFP